jgi:putative endonuclease
MRHWAEGIARQYLEKQGCQVLAENYHLRDAEVDLIIEDGNVLVFVEVKQRSSERYGTPAEAIDNHKILRLQRAALQYMSQEHGRDDLPLRFDAVLIMGNRRNYQLEHLKAIF